VSYLLSRLLEAKMYDAFNYLTTGCLKPLCKRVNVFLKE
jgi:hypothetical protein